MNILKYSNGFGHLVMSVLFAVIGLILVLTDHVAGGFSIISLVGSAWFIPGAAKQVAHEVSQKVISQPLVLDDSGDKTE